jgi:two-component system response regulator PilR (NtrC family)
MGRVLVVDDEPGIRDVLQVLLEGRGHAVDLAEAVASARSALERQDYDLLITDLRLGPETDGLEVVDVARELPRPPEIIVMTAYGSRERAQRAIARGASFYIEKGPHLAGDIGVLARQAITKRQLEEENAQLRSTILGSTGRAGIVGKSEAMGEVLDLVERVAPLRTTVLVCGESGTGKERIARALHECAPWSSGPFIPLNCGALPENLIESELFGYDKGAFTGADAPKMGVFEAARGGTLFLDEVGELPLALQPKLLRVLQEHGIRRLGSHEEVSVADVRVVAASNRDLEAAIADGAFREDLFFRLNVVQIDLPPLRERPEDIVVLAEHFLQKYARAHGRRVTSIDPDALDCLTRFRFPGNVRQLENAIERGVALARGDRLTTAELPKAIREAPSSPVAPAEEPPETAAFPPGGIDLERMLDAFERDWIERALEAAGGVKTHAAELLGLSFRQFRYKLAKHRRQRAPSKGDVGS